MNFEQEGMKGMSCGIQSADPALFLQFESDSGNGSVWDLVCSCSSLGLMIRRCIKYLLRLLFAQIKVMLCYAKFLNP